MGYNSHHESDVEDFKQRFTLGDDFVMVADSSLMNKNNVTLLHETGHKFTSSS